MPKPQLLIDADLILYKATSSAEFEADAGDDVWYLSTNLIKAKDHWKSQVDAITRRLKSDDMVFVFSGPDNFRKKVDPTYKGNRAKVRKPLGFTMVRDWAYETYGDRAISQDCLEADDYIGILATKPGAVDRIIVSEDKDFNTVPCRLFQKGDIRDIDEEAADLYWLTQTLTGDSADGYKGCPGVGAVKAAKLLAKGTTGTRWDAVRKAFIKAGLTEAEALTQARLARILRHGDWDSKLKQPILWVPNF
jgi:DNA polymerase I